MAGIPGRALRKTLTNKVSSGPEPVQTELEQLQGVAELPPARDGGHGDTLGPVQQPGLGDSEAGVPFRTGILQVDSPLTLPELCQLDLTDPQGLHMPDGPGRDGGQEHHLLALVTATSGHSGPTHRGWWAPSSHPTSHSH